MERDEESKPEDFTAEKVEDLAKIRYWNDEELFFSITEGGFLSLSLADRHYDRIVVQRAFPLSGPEEFITLRELNENREPGTEIGMIRDMRQLSPEKRALLKQELERRYFTPRIQKVTGLKDEYGYLYIDVDSTAGSKQLTVPNNTSHFIRLTSVRILIVDVDGNRYEIPDYQQMDKKSIKLLELVI